MPWAVAAAGIGLAGTVYSADQARKSSNKATDAANQANQLALMPLGTQYGSSINRGAGRSIIDPSIRAMREQSLANIPGYRQNLGQAYGLYSGQLNDIQSGLAGNQNPYLQARVNPLLQQQAMQQGSLQMDLGARGLGGSSFGNQAMTNLNTDYGRAIGDQGAMATQDTLNARTGIAGQQFSAANAANQAGMGLDQQYASVAGQNLAQELSALGLAQADIGAILGSGVLASQAQQGYAQNIGRSIGSLGQLSYGLSPYYKGSLGSSPSSSGNNPNAYADMSQFGAGGLYN